MLKNPVSLRETAEHIEAKLGTFKKGKFYLKGDNCAFIYVHFYL